MMKSRFKTSILAGLAVLLGGCEHGGPVTVAPVPPTAPSGVSLSPAARAYLGTQFDTVPMDRLLNTLTDEDRARFLAEFQDVEWAVAGRTDGETRHVTVRVYFGDAEQQRLLDQMWAPKWVRNPGAVPTAGAFSWPGTSLAKARRADSLTFARDHKGSEP